MFTFFIKTLGCKVNQYETEAIKNQLLAAGFREQPAGASVYIVNTCAVTAKAEQKCRQAFHKLRRENPAAFIVLTGCMAKLHEQLDGIDLIHADKPTLAGAICERLGAVPPALAPFTAGGSFESRSRAYVKIQDGCDRFCTYCIIPFTRGEPRSKPLRELAEECESLVAAGFSELVLCGINMCLYGVDLGAGIDLSHALNAAASAKGVEKIVLSSLEPDLLTPELLEKLTSEPKLAPEFHISLQSGSDSVLARMGRRYSAADYAAIIAFLRERYAEALRLTTDVITGFVGETPAERAESAAFVEKISFDHVHYFPYSRRPGTVAAGM